MGRSNEEASKVQVVKQQELTLELERIGQVVAQRDRTISELIREKEGLERRVAEFEREKGATRVTEDQLRREIDGVRREL